MIEKIQLRPVNEAAKRHLQVMEFDSPQAAIDFVKSSFVTVHSIEWYEPDFTDDSSTYFEVDSSFGILDGAISNVQLRELSEMQMSDLDLTV